MEGREEKVGTGRNAGVTLDLPWLCLTRLMGELNTKTRGLRGNICSPAMGHLDSFDSRQRDALYRLQIERGNSPSNENTI